MTAAEHPLSSEELMAYLDGELQPERATVVQLHVAGCAVCQRLSGELRGVSRDMARWQVEDAPASLVAPRMPDSGDNRGRSHFGWLRLRPVLTYAVAAVGVIFVIGVVGYSRLINTRHANASVSSAALLAEIPRPAGSANAPARGVDARMGGAAGVASEPTESAPAVSGRPGQVEPALAPPSTPAIARTARLRVRATNFDTARPAVDRVVAETGGLVGQVNASGARGDARTLTATLLIPANRLDAALAALKTIGVVLDETQSGDDVTGQVVDIAARLANARNTEKRLVDLLQKRTGDLADVLAAEREIARVREEIERLDAQRKNLDRRVTYATINLEVLEQQQAALDLGPRPISGLFRDALVNGTTQALDSLLGLLLLIVRLGPVLLLWAAILAWPVRAFVRWNRRTAFIPPAQ
jgi:hypothetical protein